MSEAQQPQYTHEEELDIFANWCNELYKQDPAFAETIVEGIVAAEFPEDLDT